MNHTINSKGIPRDSAHNEFALVRTPYQMAAALSTLQRIWQETDNGIEARYASMREPWMPETATGFLELLNPAAAAESAFKIFAEGMVSDKTTRHMMRLPWRIIDCADADYGLLLSDHPVVLVPLDTQNGHIAMPLTPTKFLVAAGNEGVQRSADAMSPKQAVRLLNRLTVGRAQHCVISENREQDYFIRKHFGSAPVPPFLSGGTAKFAP